MNSEQWKGLIRTVLALAIGPGSYIVLKGVLTADQANQLIDSLVPLIMAVGGIIIARSSINAHSATNLVAVVNSNSVPGVKVVSVTSPSPAVKVTNDGLVMPIAVPKATP